MSAGVLAQLPVGNDIIRGALSLFQCQALFNNYCFLFLFLPPVVIGYWLLPWRRARFLWVAAASFIFYGFFDWRFVPLLVVSSLVDFLLARAIDGSEDPQRRKRALVASVVFNLSVLGFFKYTIFFLDNVRGLGELVGWGLQIPHANIILPIGISFYTFQTMSYTIDVYRRQVKATGDFSRYLAYVTLFPQLVAGPIVRYRSIEAQLDALPRRPSGYLLNVGILLFSIGLFKKTVIADSVAAYSDTVWARPEALTTATAWFATFGYTVQLYFDFSGYSDMAIGLGALLGLQFPANFRAPYQALNPSDFWRRWHISLSTFFRDYVYIPLGGSSGTAAKVGLVTMVVMLLSGLWHGAAWTFVIWGGMHALALLGYRRIKATWDRWPRPVQMGLTVLIWAVSLVFFRAPDLDVALQMFQAMFATWDWDFGRYNFYHVLLVAVPLVAAMVIKPNADRVFRADTRSAVLAALLFVLSLTFIGSGSSPFLYYQF